MFCKKKVDDVAVPFERIEKVLQELEFLSAPY
jgi:hypothetical protein